MCSSLSEVMDIIIRLCVSHNNIFALVTGLSYHGEHWQSWGFMPKRDMY